MRIVVHEFLTLDGVMQGPGSPDEDTSGGFAHGGWMIPFSELAGWGEVVDGWFSRTSAVLFGRTTYDVMAAYWTQVTDPGNRVAAVLNFAPKYVVSSTLTSPDWSNTQVLGDDWRDRLALLKATGEGELQVHGSWRLASALHAAGLVDEYRLLVFPVTLGAGKRLFTDDAGPSGFDVARAEVLDETVVYLVLRPAPFGQGEFAVEDGGEVTRIR